MIRNIIIHHPFCSSTTKIFPTLDLAFHASRVCCSSSPNTSFHRFYADSIVPEYDIIPSEGSALTQISNKGRVNGWVPPGENRSRKFCKRTHIEPAKPAYDIRRTVATQLYRKTHNIVVVRKYPGHSYIQTTWGYIVDIDAEKDERDRVIDALRDFSKAPEKPVQKDKARNIISFPSGKKKPVNQRKTGHTMVTHIFQA